MGVEIERKFIVDKEKMLDIIGRPWISGEQAKRYPDLNITQWYLNDNVRIRLAMNRHQEQIFILTMKSDKPEDKFTRNEVEQEISKEFYQIIIQLDYPKIRKSRYFFDDGWTVDSFYFNNPDDINDGVSLFLAEIELESEDQEIVIPDWVTEEVTNDERYYNNYMAKNPYENWRNLK
jgi:adenylate cyclase